MPNLERPGYDRETGTFATLKRTWKEFSQDNLTDWAAAMTYYGVLALFPALIALVSIVGIVFSPTQITDALNQIVGQLGPSSAMQTLQGPIEGIASGGSKTGIMLIVGIVAALWAASGYVGAFMRASHVMYEVDEGRPIWKLRPLQMLVTLAMLLLVTLAALSVIVSGPIAEAVGSAVGLSDTFVTVWDYAKWPVLLAIVALMLAILYYASPNAKVGRFKFITPGALVAVVVWVIASVAFAFYVGNFGSYDKTYGTLAGVIVFLVWLWITNVAILFGAQLNAERERSEQIEQGVPDAERDLRLEERDAPKEKQKTQTA
ncbi:MAG TPA: YihY/virulence factor BrkB family protein [Solirubrobacteraceae bacterium]|nr:YihY/virulence factor BrkB family protein [Solirubrobacteraceae bacterium]